MSSAKLGLRARGVLSMRVTGPARITAASFTTSQCRTGAGAYRAHLESFGGRISEQPSPSAQQMGPRRDMKDVANLALSVLLPATFVLPPFSEFPPGLKQKLKMLYTWAIYKIQETATNLAIKIASKPSIFRRALLKTNRSSDILTAKALHRTLAEALAAGDKNTIARICPRKFSAPLLTSIDARPRTRRYGWELVTYTKTAYYPTIKAQRLAPLLPTKGSPILRQVVVAISSRQRRVVYDAQGQVVPGSEKEMDVIENVAIGCIIDGHTYKQGDWRILGSVKPSTLEGHQREKRFAERSNARQQ